jgi:hypothetical protein
LGHLQPFDLGPIDQVCKDCGAKHWKAELPANCTINNQFWMSCCKAGAVKIDLLKEPPPYLKDLYDDITVRGRNFKAEIRKYNSAFAFTSLKCEINNAHISNMPFQIHGQMYHLQGPLTAENTSLAKYAQLYIFDPEYAATIRSNNNVELDEGIIKDLSLVLHEHNPHIKVYKSAFELLTNTENTSSDNISRFIRIHPSMRIELVAGATNLKGIHVLLQENVFNEQSVDNIIYPELLLS